MYFRIMTLQVVVQEIPFNSIVRKCCRILLLSSCILYLLRNVRPINDSAPCCIFLETVAVRLFFHMDFFTAKIRFLKVYSGYEGGFSSFLQTLFLQSLPLQSVPLRLKTCLFFTIFLLLRFLFLSLLSFRLRSSLNLFFSP